MSKKETTMRRMQEGVNTLKQTIPDKQRQAEFDTEMVEFYKLFGRYLDQINNNTVLDWNTIKTPGVDQLKPYAELQSCPKERIKHLLSGLVVLKLNGGLGTTMGCSGPKSVIEVRNGLTFLDLIVKQIQSLNQTYGVDVPLVLMNSFNTNDDTAKIIQKYDKQNVTVLTFNQKQFPRIDKERMMPMPKTADPSKINVEEWFPPGHGDVYDSFYRSPLYKKLIDQGKKYMFISNVDNLGATVDLNILNHLESHAIEFCMEVTKKTRADVKGGTLIDQNGKIKLLELAQVPKDRVEEFKSIKKFKIFNTNNLWISLPAIETHLKDLENIEIIINQKSLGGGLTILQLETAAGAAIQLFSKSIGIQVERDRFLPVKSCSDLLMIQSNLYSLKPTGYLELNPLRSEKMGEDYSIPQIKFVGDEFKKVKDYLSRFESMPDILELESLTVVGDVKFGSNITLKGSVIVMAQGGRLEVPSGSSFENKVISGSLKILDQ